MKFCDITAHAHMRTGTILSVCSLLATVVAFLDLYLYHLHVPAYAGLSTAPAGSQLVNLCLATSAPQSSVIGLAATNLSLDGDFKPIQPDRMTMQACL